MERDQALDAWVDSADDESEADEYRNATWIGYEYRDTVEFAILPDFIFTAHISVY
jgi:hypothetical protein